MKIEIHKEYEPDLELLVYYADAIDLPGTPPQGCGHTMQEAVGSLILAMRHESEWQKYGWPNFEIRIKTKI